MENEEIRFSETLDKGLSMLEDSISELKKKNETVIPGKVAFNLYDTFGFPLDLTEDILKNKSLKYCKGSGGKIINVAVCGGSGSDLIQAAINKNVDAFITADIKYHTFQDAENLLTLVDAGHYETERFTKKLIHDHHIEKLPNFAIALSKSITNPVKYFSDGKKK